MLKLTTKHCSLALLFLFSFNLYSASNTDHSIETDESAEHSRLATPTAKKSKPKINKIESPFVISVDADKAPSAMCKMVAYAPFPTCDILDEVSFEPVKNGFIVSHPSFEISNQLSIDINLTLATFAQRSQYLCKTTYSDIKSNEIQKAKTSCFLPD